MLAGAFCCVSCCCSLEVNCRLFAPTLVCLKGSRFQAEALEPFIGVDRSAAGFGEDSLKKGNVACITQSIHVAVFRCIFLQTIHIARPASFRTSSRPARPKPSTTEPSPTRHTRNSVSINEDLCSNSATLTDQRAPGHHQGANRFGKGFDQGQREETKEGI